MNRFVHLRLAHLLSLLLAPLMVMLFSVSLAQAQTTTFTYQGRFTDSQNGGNATTGSYDFQFKLFDALTVGNQLGNTVDRNAVAVTNSAFTVQLDFGAAAFPGANRWLEISVRQAGGGSFSTLNPRQPVTATPYAIKSLNAAAADGLSAACNGCVTNTQLGAGSTNYIQNTATQQATSNFNISGNGLIAGKVGIGTLSPMGNLEVNSASTAVIIATAHGSSAQFLGQSAGGTPGAETAVTAGTSLAWFGARGHDGTGFTNSRAAIILNASQNWNSAAHGTEIVFGTTANGTTSRLERMRISEAGNIGVGTTTPGSLLTVAGTIESTSGGVKFPDGTTQTTAATTAANYVFAYDTTLGGQSAISAFVFKDVTFDTNALLNGWTHSPGAASFTCTQLGLYLIQYTAEVQANSAVVTLRATRNGRAVDGSEATFGPNTTVVHSAISKSFIYLLGPDDALKLQFAVSIQNQAALNGSSGLGLTKPNASITIIKIQ